MVARKHGCILNISSMNAYIPLTKIPAYSGAKAAVSNFTQWLATHFAGSGIRANAIAPGFIETPMTASMNQDALQEALKSIPLRRMGKAEDVAAAAAFLASDEAGYITGTVINVDGGFFMR